MNFIEKLSCTLGKQYLYKQGKDEYWNRYIGSTQTKEEAQDWLIHYFNELDNEEYEVNDNVKAVFVKSTKEILYSRSRHDFRYSSDKTIAVDGGRDYFKMVGDLENVIIIELNPIILLEQILHYDYRFKNSNATKWKDGYYGKFKLDYTSNEHFYKRLIVKGFDEVWNWLQKKNIEE